MRIRALILGTAILAAVAPAVASATTLPDAFGETTLASGDLSAPTAVDWAPDGRMFIAEKDGRVRVVAADGTLSPSPLLDLSDKVNSFSDRGLLGLAVDTDFATNRYLYLLYVYELNPLDPDSDAPMVSRLTRVTVKANNTLEKPDDPETVILGSDFGEPCPLPNNTVDCIPADFKWHVIGTVRSDPDGSLWVSTGDTHAPTPIDDQTYRPYDQHSFAGKLIHIDREGHGLPDHPFCPGDADLTHTCTKIYAKGFRNPFRFTLRPGKGPIVGDVGSRWEEEIDLVRAGDNYGWPCYEGAIRTVLYESELRCQEEYAKEGSPEAASPPAWSYERDESGGGAVVVGPVYEGDNYPAEYKTNVFVGDYVQGWVKRLSLNSNDEVTAVEDFATDWAPGVDLEPMPNGDLAYVDIGFGSTASIRRFTYANGNRPPVPVATANPSQGDAPLRVQFTGRDSSDPEDDPITYNWDFGDGSAHSSEADSTHVYTETGTYTASLSVDDGYNRNPNVTVSIQVGSNSPPVAAITAPADESTYQAGDVINLTGSGDDAEDGPLAGEALTWSVYLRHGTHLHTVKTFSGVQGQFTPYRDHDADSHYEVILTATDSGGRTAQQRIELRPETAEVTLESSPPGAPIRYANTGPFQTPLHRIGAVGFEATIEVDETFEQQGRTYSFSHWLHGGPRKQVFTVPAVDTILTAVYERGGGVIPPPVIPPPVIPPPVIPPPVIPPPDRTIDGFVSAKRKQAGRHIVVKVTAKEDLRAKGKAEVKVRRKYFRFESRNKFVSQGKKETLRLKPRKKRQAKKIAKALRKGRKAEAELKVRLTDEAGNTERKKLKVRFRR